MCEINNVFLSIVVIPQQRYYFLSQRIKENRLVITFFQFHYTCHHSFILEIKTSQILFYSFSPEKVSPSNLYLRYLLSSSLLLPGSIRINNIHRELVLDYCFATNQNKLNVDAAHQRRRKMM